MTPSLFHESITDALRECVQALGGFKKVGHPPPGLVGGLVGLEREFIEAAKVVQAIAGQMQRIGIKAVA